MNTKKKKPIIGIDVLIIVVIAACIIFLNSFTTSKLNELEQAGTEAMFIKEGLDYKESEQLGEEIIKYRPDSCKMIEMYDESFELLFALQFDKTHPIYNYNINNYPELIDLLNKNQEGQTAITIDGYNEDVYFQWVTNSRDEKRLVMVYSTKHIVEDIWVFSFVCYLLLILVFILLIRTHHINYKDKINQYKKVSSNFRDAVNRK